MGDLWGIIPWRELVGVVLAVGALAGLVWAAKGTRAIRVMTGVGAVAGVVLAGEWLDLYPRGWETGRYWPEALLAIVILFQPELRRVLARIGRNPFRRRNESEETRLVEEIVKASIALATRRIGAIMVVEREHDLMDLVEVGCVIDARVSKELLMSLFLPYSPLHDGAVILRGGRIAAAGCFLPLSTGDHGVETYGTRHRAALGITEETDAVAIVISEETGTVSLIVAGEMQRAVDAAVLRQRLTAALAVGGTAPGPARLSRARL